MRARDPAVLSRALSRVENGAPGFEGLLSALRPELGRAHRIGVTGPPGAGKSTLVERLVAGWSAAGGTTAVVAVDPSSPRSGGALLGDRVRMDRLALDPGVFIRSMATRGALGGLALSTGEVCDVLDGAGFARIVVETAGVGQAELDVASEADSTVLVLVPESGDGIQVLKSGLIELADLLIVNKADRPGAERLVSELEVSLRIRAGKAYGPAPGPERDRWRPRVLSSIATLGDGVGGVAEALEAHRRSLAHTGEGAARRFARQERQLRAIVMRALGRDAWERSGAESLLRERLQDVLAGRLSPYALAERAIARLGS